MQLRCAISAAVFYSMVFFLSGQYVREACDTEKLDTNYLMKKFTPH